MHLLVTGLSLRVHGFIMNNAIACFHPLNAARKNFRMVATAVKVLRFTTEHIGQRCNTPMGMGACPLLHLWLSGRMFYGRQVIKKNKGAYRLCIPVRQDPVNDHVPNVSPMALG